MKDATIGLFLCCVVASTAFGQASLWNFTVRSVEYADVSEGDASSPKIVLKGNTETDTLAVVIDITSASEIVYGKNEAKWMGKIPDVVLPDTNATLPRIAAEVKFEVHGSNEAKWSYLFGVGPMAGEIYLQAPPETKIPRGRVFTLVATYELPKGKTRPKEMDICISGYEPLRTTLPDNRNQALQPKQKAKKAPARTSKPDTADEAGVAQYRTWTSADGRFHVEAKLVKLDDETIHLARSDNGKIVAVPLAKLSPDDRSFVRGQSTETSMRMAESAAGDLPYRLTIDASSLPRIVTAEIEGQEPRTWTDVRGRTITAVLISSDGTSVTLRKDGKDYTVPLSRFSTADSKYVHQAAANRLSPRTWTDVRGRTITAVLVSSDGTSVTLRKDGKDYTVPLSRLSKPDSKYVHENKSAGASQSAPEIEQDTGVSLPKIRTAFQGRVGEMGGVGTLVATFDKSGKRLPIVFVPTLRGKFIRSVCADMQRMAVYRMSGSPKDPPAAELKSIKCDVELKVDGKIFSGSVEGKVTIIDSSLPDNVRADCRTVAARALGAGNCLDVRGRFGGFHLIIFDDSGAVVRTHCLVCTNLGSRLQSDSYRIVPATVTVKGAAASQSVPSEVMYVKPRLPY